MLHALCSLLDQPPATRMCTPTYAPPEVLDGNQYTQQSDLASLGYVLIELQQLGISLIVVPMR